MARIGKAGLPIILQVKFFENGDLFNPFSVSDVNIFTVIQGGITIETLTPVNVSLGIFEVTWNVPITQLAGTYYDEWTWVAQMGMDPNVQRYEFIILPDKTIIAAPTPIIPKTSKKPKVANSRTAVGYWGRNPEKRIDVEEIPERIRALHQDKLLSRGKSVSLWQQVDVNTANSLVCSCVKDTTDKADNACASCYGSKFIPGYIKFGHETLFMSSISVDNSLINTIVDTDIKPNRILLNDMSISGSVTSGKISFSNVLNNNWEFNADFANINENNQVVFSFSTDGITYHTIEQINEGTMKPIGNGFIFLRASLSRPDVNTRSPEVEMMRIRHADIADPFIKILRPQVSENPMLTNIGRRNEHLAERFWTVPLDFFDNRIPKDTPSARILENALYERIDGINAGNRYVVTKLYYNEEFGSFTQQSFNTRRTQSEEVYNRILF